MATLGRADPDFSRTHLVIASQTAVPATSTARSSSGSAWSRGAPGRWPTRLASGPDDHPDPRAARQRGQQAAAHLGIVQAGQRDHVPLVQQHGDSDGLQRDADIGGDRPAPWLLASGKARHRWAARPASPPFPPPWAQWCFRRRKRRAHRWPAPTTETWRRRRRRNRPRTPAHRQRKNVRR